MKKLLIIVSLVLLSLSSVSVYAAKPCKGLSKSACSSSKECTWVSGYTSKAGKKVGAYCRSASGKGKKTGAVKDKKKTSVKNSPKSGKKEAKQKSQKTKKKEKKKKQKKSKKEQDNKS